MDTRWLKGIPKDQVEARRKEVLQYRNTFDLLREVIEREFKDSVTEPDYDSPSWSHKQAHRNGYNSALQSILNLLSVKEKDDHVRIRH